MWDLLGVAKGEELEEKKEAMESEGG